MAGPADFANERHATMIVIGAPGEKGIAKIFDASLTSEVVRDAQCAVHIVAPAAEAYHRTHSVR
jgi:nucleotide-binding universal stress UspA family protein